MNRFPDSIPEARTVLQTHGHTASKKSLTASKTQMQFQRKAKLIWEMTHPTKRIPHPTPGDHLPQFICGFTKQS